MSMTVCEKHHAVIARRPPSPKGRLRAPAINKVALGPLTFRKRCFGLRSVCAGRASTRPKSAVGRPLLAQVGRLRKPPETGRTRTCFIARPDRPQPRGRLKSSHPYNTSRSSRSAGARRDGCEREAWPVQASSAAPQCSPRFCFRLLRCLVALAAVVPALVARGQASRCPEGRLRASHHPAPVA